MMNALTSVPIRECSHLKHHWLPAAAEKSYSARWEDRGETTHSTFLEMLDAHPEFAADQRPQRQHHDPDAGYGVLGYLLDSMAALHRPVVATLLATEYIHTTCC